MNKLEKLVPFFIALEVTKMISGGQQKPKKGKKRVVSSDKTDTQKNDHFGSKPSDSTSKAKP